MTSPYREPTEPPRIPRSRSPWWGWVAHAWALVGCGVVFDRSPEWGFGPAIGVRVCVTFIGLLLAVSLTQYYARHRAQ